MFLKLYFTSILKGCMFPFFIYLSIEFETRRFVLCYHDILRHQNNPSINHTSTTDKGLMLMS